MTPAGFSEDDYQVIDINIGSEVFTGLVENSKSSEFG